MNNIKTHDYKKFAKKYADIGITDSFYLAYRDIPEIVQKYVHGTKALDHGCGSGRSSRFLEQLGFETIGIDSNKDMITEARQGDPYGNYEMIKDNKFPVEDKSVDLVFSCIVFMEYSSKKRIVETLHEMQRVLKDDGVVIIITDTFEAYTGDWASFCFDFPENQNLKSGDKAKCVFRGTNIVFYDYVWLDEDYKESFEKTAFELAETRRPLAKGGEPYQWHSETKLPLWAVYVLKKKKLTNNATIP